MNEMLIETEDKIDFDIQEMKNNLAESEKLALCDPISYSKVHKKIAFLSNAVDEFEKKIKFINSHFN